MICLKCLHNNSDTDNFEPSLRKFDLQWLPNTLNATEILLNMVKTKYHCNL